MTEQEIKQTLADVQRQLDTLQNEKASFMFVANEGNEFVISGNPVNIMSQISFAMMRYPVVRDIIQKCADSFDGMNAAFGEKAKNTKMDHLIKKNAGGN